MGLWEAIIERFRNIKASEQISTTIKGVPEQLRLDPTKELAIYRVIQELVTNSIRHSEAQELLLSVNYLNDTLRIEFSDDGKGLTKNESTNGIGFLNMKSRIEAIQGKISFDSVEEKGFKAFIQIDTK